MSCEINIWVGYFKFPCLLWAWAAFRMYLLAVSSSSNFNSKSKAARWSFFVHGGCALRVVILGKPEPVAVRWRVLLSSPLCQPPFPARWLLGCQLQSLLRNRYRMIRALPDLWLIITSHTFITTEYHVLELHEYTKFWDALITMRFKATLSILLQVSSDGNQITILLTIAQISFCMHLIDCGVCSSAGTRLTSASRCWRCEPLLNHWYTSAWFPTSQFVSYSLSFLG